MEASLNSAAFPFRARDLTCERLTQLVRSVHPEAIVGAFTVTDEKVYDPEKGEVSSAARIDLDLALTAPVPLAGTHKVTIKVCAPEIGFTVGYRNEVAFYTRLRPELESEVPRCFGAEFDEASGSFGLALENLHVRGATFPNVKTPITLGHMRRLLDTLAALHARYWESPRFDDDLAFIEPHVGDGEGYELFNNPKKIAALVRSELDIEQFKREMVQAASRSADDLNREFRKLQWHQATLPQTVCHGDTHIGNTYVLPDGTVGLLDWQLVARGYALHDVTYLLITGLSVEQRRENQRELIRHYLQRLRENGVTTAPDFEEAWLEYRRAVVWGVYIGWLTTSIGNYGWDITVCNVLRLVTAYQDLDTAAALRDLPDAPPYTG